MSRKRVLVIDDERIIRQLLTKSLSDEGYDVVTASDALEGLEKIERDTFDIVLVDLKLPGKDGLEVLQIIKENNPEILGILITAYPSIETARQSMKTGAFSYITKPLDPDEVSRVIEEGLEKKAFEAEAIELGERCNILVVDDDEVILKLLKSVLADEGYGVQTARSGHEALEKIRKGFFNLMLTDLKMPEIDGIDLLGKARKIDPEILAVIITAYPSVESVVESIRECAYDYITKPFDPDEVLQVVKRGWEKQRLEIQNKQLLRNLQLKNDRLRESEKKFKDLFTQIPDAVYVYDVETLKIIDANDKALAQYGFSREEFLSLTIRDIQTPEVNAKMAETLKKPVKKDEVITLGSAEHRRKSGEIFSVGIAYNNIRVNQKFCGIVIARDITETKRLQAEFQQAQKMEAMGTLSGGIAHDFNNLLMGIQGRTSLMLMDTDSSHPHFEHLRGIEEYVQNAADLTKQLLGFARGGKYEVKPTDLNALIKTISSMFGRTKKEIKINRKYQKDIWTVEVDQGQIEQVLLNLYVNAWQAMPGGGELCLETENVSLDEDYLKPFVVEPGRYVKISITDTGVGMDESTQQRIFEPFFTTKEMGRGTGLGLASVYGIIKNHGGIINVYSEKGEGTTFTIYLPASEKEIIEEKELPGKILKGSETILLVDDEDMIIDVGKDILKALGYKVLVVRSGKEAIELYKANKDKIDMVILDMIMPGVGGGETYDRMKAINPDIKVLLSSGYSINGQATEILERGCNGFIQKPFSMKKLSQELRKILDS